MTRNRLHRILKSAGFKTARNKYDAEGYSLIEFVDYLGIQPAFNVPTSAYADALHTAGVEIEMGNQLLVRKVV